MTQIKVTTWANGDRDFASGRWVQLGAPTLLNFWLTGLPGGSAYNNLYCCRQIEKAEWGWC